jgi:peptide deformylase
MKILKLRRIGDPILRRSAKKLTKDEILSDKVQNLINNIKYTCDKRDYGVGLSAPQVGEPLAISVVAIKPTPTRPDAILFYEVLINAKITKTFGKSIEKWEGCCSVGGPAFKDLIFGLVPRYKKVQVSYLDRHGNPQEKIVESFIAHVIQHETDHINGILFTDLANPKSLMMGNEYKERIIKSRKPQP